MSLIGLWCKYQGNEIFSQQLLTASNDNLPMVIFF